MSEPVIFFIDDEATIRQAITQTLALEDLPVRAFADGPSALAELTPDFPGIILCDYHMPGMDGLAVLQAVQACDDSIPLIILTGQGDISTAVAAMRQGAYDFIEKPFHHDGLIEILKRAMDKRALALENRRLKAQLRVLARPGPRLLGSSSSMQALLALLDPLLGTAADILLYGETGAGKDAIARYIHENSPRSEHNFVAINCGAVPENLIESELFGHEAGAFTGADKRRIGKFEHAHKGTLFLDELESMPLNLQVRLLRVLEERKIERLGSNQSIPVDVRVIAASKSDLKALSDAGDFRADLFYRLNVLRINIPPLRERRQDVPLLFHHFALIAASRYDREIIPLDASQAAALMQHDWPGNVRELRNLAERYVLMGAAALNDPDSPQLPAAGSQQTLAEMVDTYERSLIANALNACNGSIKQVMMQLGLARKTLYDKMKRHGLDKADYKD
ncbi:sigma-54-dependent transcriptional regulator [Halopseudomonas maritima]|uniref:sigma-54-dependent transcriptional regulator n=1 Tax=Halopseudomonas maritima TaxID=2918528 RepID=UPI001EEA8AD6|nr:sigma-54 dependent transcriptional regulator [Halopseudomonas maritima]UJJ32582.1 sigma-54 dependent transcriptional regulator [Halopseudomonas maritima]